MLTEGQNNSESNQVEGQKALNGAEMIAKLARKLKSISNSNRTHNRHNQMAS